MPEAANPELLRAHLAMLRPPAVAFSDWDFTPELVKMARDAGCQVFLDRLGETDTTEHWQAAIRAGASGIQTDRPTALVEWLDRQW
jgi:glycerophosphoryl diester phosphodiesterase